MSFRIRPPKTALALLAAAGVVLSACDGVTVGASYGYGYNDAFYWNDYYRNPVYVGGRPDRPDRPARPDRPDRPDAKPPNRPHPPVAKPPNVRPPSHKPSRPSGGRGGGRRR